VDYFPIDQRKRAYQKLLQSLSIRRDQLASKPGAEVKRVPLVTESLISDMEKEEPVIVQNPRSLTVSVPLTPNGIIDLSGLIFSIVFFLLAALFAFGNAGNPLQFFLALSGILTGFVYLLKRQVSASAWVKITTIIFIIVHTLKTYSDFSGFYTSPLLSILEGVTAMIVVGSLVANLQSTKKPALFASLFFAVFLFLFATKLILNLFGFYPSGMFIPLVISGIIASILLWLEQ
jgi:hypothetical protein